jgi:hypothetical protein
LVPGAWIVLIPPVNLRGPLASFPTTVANVSGVYVLEDVPPGEYRLLALDLAGLPIGVAEAPEFLRQFERRGELITVGPGARMIVNPEAILAYD